MTLDADKITVRTLNWPDDTPFWPCALFMYGDEIVGALFFDDEDVGGYELDAQGVIDRDARRPSSSVPPGWCLQIIAEAAPSADDPREMAPEVDVWGDLPVLDAMRRAYEAVRVRARPLGLSYEASRERLLWGPLVGWDKSQ